MQHSDADRRYHNEAFTSDAYQKYIYGTTNDGTDFPSNTAVELPETSEASAAEPSKPG